ncbi:MAG: PorP/SprF family type IX secretion system membrane protein, partial [Bacteroidota bacterium]
MRLAKTLLLSLSLLLSSNLFAQDVHFSMYDMSPLVLNPANTGAFLGSIRVGGIYRDQWRSVFKSGNQFSTPSFYADAPIINGFGKQDWVGVGVMMYSDQAGLGQLTTNSFMFSAAYHRALDRKAKNVLTLGVQGGIVARSVDLQSTDLKFEDEFVLGGGNGVFGSGEDRPNASDEDISTNYLDLSAGLLLTSRLSKTNYFNLGFAMAHLTTPNYSLLDPSPGVGSGGGGGQNNIGPQLPLRFTGHGMMHLDLGDKWMFEPMAYYVRIGPAQEIAAQAWGGIYMDEEKEKAIRFGLGYRLADAGEILLGYDFKTLRVGLSYDVNVSPLR